MQHPQVGIQSTLLDRKYITSLLPKDFIQFGNDPLNAQNLHPSHTVESSLVKQAQCIKYNYEPGFSTPFRTEKSFGVDTTRTLQPVAQLSAPVQRIRPGQEPTLGLKPMSTADALSLLGKIKAQVKLSKNQPIGDVIKQVVMQTVQEPKIDPTPLVQQLRTDLKKDQVRSQQPKSQVPLLVGSSRNKPLSALVQNYITTRVQKLIQKSIVVDETVAVVPTTIIKPQIVSVPDFQSTSEQEMRKYLKAQFIMDGLSIDLSKTRVQGLGKEQLLAQFSARRGQPLRQTMRQRRNGLHITPMPDGNCLFSALASIVEYDTTDKNIIINKARNLVKLALGVLPPAPVMSDLKYLSSFVNIIYIPKDCDGYQKQLQYLLGQFYGPAYLRPSILLTHMPKYKTIHASVVRPKQGSLLFNYDYFCHALSNSGHYMLKNVVDCYISGPVDLKTCSVNYVVNNPSMDFSRTLRDNGAIAVQTQTRLVQKNKQTQQQKHQRQIKQLSRLLVKSSLTQKHKINKINTVSKEQFPSIHSVSLEKKMEAPVSKRKKYVPKQQQVLPRKPSHLEKSASKKLYKEKVSSQRFEKSASVGLRNNTADKWYQPRLKPLPTIRQQKQKYIEKNKIQPSQKTLTYVRPYVSRTRSPLSSINEHSAKASLKEGLYMAQSRNVPLQSMTVRRQRGPREGQE